MAEIASRVQICSNALIMLGDRPISSLTEDTTGATLGANLFENTYISMLQNHRWRFAVKSQKLAKFTVAPNTGYTSAFALPNDFLYVIKGSHSNYEIYGKELHANTTDFQIDYVFRVEEDTLPAYFVKALEYNLSEQFAVPLTGDLNKADYFGKRYLEELRRAKFTDSTQYTEVAVVHSPYTDVRF